MLFQERKLQFQSERHGYVIRIHNCNKIAVRLLQTSIPRNRCSLIFLITKQTNVTVFLRPSLQKAPCIVGRSIVADYQFEFLVSLF